MKEIISNLMKAPFRLLFGVSFRFMKRMTRDVLYEDIWQYLDKISQEANGLKVLNIGSGGEISRIIKDYKNFYVISIDIDPERSPDFIMDVCSLEFPDESFDLVCIMEVLEHVSEPAKALDEIYRVLRFSGKLMLSTPFIFGIHDAPHDYYRYTRYGLLHLLKRFQKVEITERNKYLNSIVILPCRLLMSKFRRDKVIGVIFSLILMLLLPLVILLDQLILTKNITTGYFAIASKH